MTKYLTEFEFSKFRQRQIFFISDYMDFLLCNAKIELGTKIKKIKLRLKNNISELFLPFIYFIVARQVNWTNLLVKTSRFCYIE